MMFASDAWSAVNDVLQAKPQAAVDNVVRLTVNSTFGLFGVLDIATEMGVEPQREASDLRSVVGDSAKGIHRVPLLGPSTVRDTIALWPDRRASASVVFKTDVYQYRVVGLQIIDARANFLGASQLLDEIALDNYTFMRDAYLQRRRNLVFDGDAPPQPADPADGPGSAQVQVRSVLIPDHCCPAK